MFFSELVSKFDGVDIGMFQFFVILYDIFRWENVYVVSMNELFGWIGKMGLEREREREREKRFFEFKFKICSGVKLSTDFGKTILYGLVYMPLYMVYGNLSLFISNLLLLRT